MATNKPNPLHRELLVRLFHESRVRGIHAFGFSHWDGSSVVTQRFLRLDLCLAALPAAPTRLIGHCRYSTSGDHASIENNQPVRIGDAALVFNGVISMATKAEYEQHYGRQYATNNDGEIFLDKFVREDAWESFVAFGRFSFAGLLLHREKLIALRNPRRPLYQCDEAGSRFYASTADIFRRAGFLATAEPVPTGVAYYAA